MSIQAVGRARPHTFQRQPTAFGRLIRFVRAVFERRRAEQEISGLSERYLRDIGIDRPQFAEVAKREAALDFLIESGWPPSRRAHRP